MIDASLDSISMLEVDISLIGRLLNIMLMLMTLMHKSLESKLVKGLLKLRLAFYLRLG